MGGRLPGDPEELQALMTQIKTQCHLLEGTHAGPRSLADGWSKPAETGTFWWADDPPQADQWDYTGGSYATWNDEHDYYYGADDSETEDEQHDLTEEEMYEFYGDLQNATVDQLRNEYLFAKRRFRHFAGRPPRRDRWQQKGGKSGGKGGGFRKGGKYDGGMGKNSGSGKSYMGDIIGPASLAGGKGKGKGKGKFGARAGNPRTKESHQMRCHGCNSDQHLVRDCWNARPDLQDPRPFKFKTNYDEDDLFLLDMA